MKKKSIKEVRENIRRLELELGIIEPVVYPSSNHSPMNYVQLVQQQEWLDDLRKK